MNHPRFKPILLIGLIFSVLSTPFFATTIVPFDNYAEMAKASKSVVLAKVVRVLKETIGNKTFDVFEFEVNNNIKGNLSVNKRFKIKTFGHTTNDGLQFVVPDDLSFDAGRTYLLSLSDLNNGFKQPRLLNYAIFEEIKLNNRTYLVPTESSKHVALMPTISGNKPEPLINVEEVKFIENLKQSLYNSRAWNIFDSKTDKALLSEIRAEPDGCTFFFRDLSVTPPIAGLRWENILTQPIYLWKQNPGDLSLTPPNLAYTYVNSALSALMQQYPVKFTDGGNISYSPDCTEEDGVVDFLSNRNVAGVEPDRRAIINFNDPCNELDDLTQNGGSLAIGGTYYCTTSTIEGHNFNNEFWRNACYGYVIVNNGVGAYFNRINNTTSANNYTIMLTHELTHVLGIGHITPAEGYLENNMNPSCCNPISNKDKECVNYAYAAQGTLPVELTSFDARSDGDIVNIEWTSATEVNHAHYTLERSFNGKDFMTLKKVMPKGSETKAAAYQYQDLLPNKGINYYRLRMTGKEGKDELSKTISIAFKNTKISMKIFPNPTEGAVNFHIMSPNSDIFSLEIFDVMGRQILNNKIDNTLKENTLSIPTRNWAKGIYYVRLSDNTSVITQKLIKS